MEESKKLHPQPMRWKSEEWALLAEVAKSVGLSRSAFVRRAAIEAAKASMACVPAYSVGMPIGISQNTRPNHFDQSIAQQGSGRSGGGGEPNHVSPAGDHGANFGKIGAARGGDLTNGAKTKAPRAKSSRS